MVVGRHCILSMLLYSGTQGCLWKGMFSAEDVTSEKEGQRDSVSHPLGKGPLCLWDLTLVDGTDG